MLAGIGIAACLEPSGGNSAFEPLLNPKNTTTTWMEVVPHQRRSHRRDHRHHAHHLVRPGPRDAGGTVVGEVLELDPDKVRVMRSDSINALPSNSPVGSRMAIMLGGATFHAARKIKEKLIAIGAHDLGIPRERAVYKDGSVSIATRRQLKRSWAELVFIAHRHFHRLPAGMEPGLSVSDIIRCRPAAHCRRRTGGCRCIPASRSSSI